MGSHGLGRHFSAARPPDHPTRPVAWAAGDTHRRWRRWAAIVAITVPAMVLSALSGPVSAAPVARVAAAAACPVDGCAVTIDARDLASGSPLGQFNYLVNLDNTKLPSDPTALSTESNSPIVREGDQDRATVTLPAGRYLISVRARDHNMWGKHITLPDDAAADGTLTSRIDLTEQSEAHPLPLGKIRVFVFNDNLWTNGAPDTDESGLAGFHITLREQTDSQV